jgi:hypothetical protein
LTDWIEDIEKLTTDNPIKLVIANKDDLEDKVVTEEDAAVINCNLKYVEFHKENWNRSS